MRHAFLLSALILFATAVAAAAPDNSTLARLLTPEEFAQAGLDKLSSGELSALEAALAAHQLLPAAKHPAPPLPASSPTASVARQSPSPDLGAEQVAAVVATANTSGELRTHIEGTLEGYSGRAIFKLANGQIWQVRTPETVYFLKKLVDPEVVITHGLGGYKMLIIPADRIAYVKRLQ
jgi:hypothetical protein